MVCSHARSSKRNLKYDEFLISQARDALRKGCTLSAASKEFRIPDLSASKAGDVSWKGPEIHLEKYVRSAPQCFAKRCPTHHTSLHLRHKEDARKRIRNTGSDFTVVLTRQTPGAVVGRVHKQMPRLRCSAADERQSQRRQESILWNSCVTVREGFCLQQRERCTSSSITMANAATQTRRRGH